MNKHISRLSVVGASVLTGACIGASGLAAADSISMTGPGSRNIISSGSYGGGQYSDWNSWNPDTWQSNGRSFDDWWNGMMRQLGGYGSSWNGGYGSNWSPYGNNWQSNWSNWNPYTWQSNGQSYGNWYAQVRPYMISHYSSWKNNWRCNNYGNNYGNKGNYGGGNYDGNKYGNRNYGNRYDDNYGNRGGYGGNSNYQQSSYHNSNNGYGGSQNYRNRSYNSGGGYGGGISTTGPRSVNRIETTSRNSFTQTNNNNVRLTNTNTQTARTGNATVRGNTHGGEATSGDAYNSNSADFEVSIDNSN
jgi:hypothetical protein